MKTNWEYIGGHQWSLINCDSEFKDTVCTVEMERGKLPVVGYVHKPLTKEELQELLNIVFDTII